MKPARMSTVRVLLWLLCLATAACAQTRRERSPAWYLPDAEPVVCSPSDCLDPDEEPAAFDAALDAATGGDAATAFDATADARIDAEAAAHADAGSAGCTRGYSWGAEASVCQDLDECAIDNGGCGDPTYFRCGNRPGPTPECADIDECAAPDACRGYACTNLPGAPPLCASNCPGDSDDARGDGSLCLARVQQITGNYDFGHQCALLKDGSLRCWGRIAPFERWPKDKFSLFSSADRQVCGVSQGEVLCWYLSSPGDIRRAPGTGRKLVTLNYPESYLLLRHDGTLAGAGDALDPSATYRDVDSASGRHCAVESSGRLVCWGFWKEEQVAPIRDLTEHGFSAVAMGANHACALRESGALRCFNINTAQAASVAEHVSGPNAETATDFVQVGVGRDHTCGLHRDGKIQCWGPEREKVVGPNASELRFVRMNVSEAQTCAFTARDAMRCWGDGLGLLRHANAPETTRLLDQRACAVRSDGSLGCTSTDIRVASVPGASPNAALRDYLYMQRGACVLQSDGRVVCWGQPEMTALNEQCQDQRFASITSNRDSLCGTRADGSVRCFETHKGVPDEGMIDHLNADGERYRMLAMSDNHLCVLRQSGRLACWGTEQPGVSGPNASGETYIAVATDDEGTCAISARGRITCWSEKQVDFAATFPQDFSQIALNYTGLYGLRKDGSIYAYSVAGIPISSGFEWQRQRFTQLVSTDDGVCALSSMGEVVCRGQFYVDGGALVTAAR